MNNKYERALKQVTPQPTTLVGKGERLTGTSDFLKQADPTLQEITRQKSKGEIVGTVIRTKDVMTLLNQAQLGCLWGIIPLDKLVEWAWENGIPNFQALRDQYQVQPIGGSECTIEVACDPARSDIIQAFQTAGVAGLKQLLTGTGEQIATDTPGIAAYFFGEALLFQLLGSIEALPKSFAPVIIGLVESGNSLREENWLRLADSSPEAVLLRSQLVVVKKISVPASGSI